MKPNRQILAVVVFNALYMLAAVPLAVLKGNTEFLFYIVMMFVFFAAVIWVYFRVHLSIPALWGLSLWGFMHMAGGLVAVPASWPVNDAPVLYSLWLIPDLLKYDNVVHAFGFGVTTWVCWQGLASMVSDKKPTFGKLTLAVTAGLGFGALNEVLEFVATLLVENTHVGGYINTGWDLVANLIGALTAALLIRFAYQKNQSELPK